MAAAIKSHLFVAAGLVFMASLTSGTHLMVNTTAPVFEVDSEYVSVTLDFQLIAGPPTVPRWYTLDTKNPRVISLLRGLSPCYLRFGGSQADMTVLSDPPASLLYDLPTGLRLSTMYTSDVDRLVELTRAAGCRLLLDLNLELRYAGGWDPTNALLILNHMVDRGYGANVDFELGNEPDVSKSDVVPPWPYPPTSHDGNIAAPGDLSGKQIGADYLILKKLIGSIPNFRDSKLVGTDIVTVDGLKRLMPDFLKTAGGNISGTTFHQYYFNGLNAPPSEYINPEHFKSLQDNINIVKTLVKENSPRKDLPIWIGETADAWHSGTQHVSDRYISGFLWLEKLGLAAQMGIGVVMRQTFYGGFYGLIDDNLYPNPDYWVSYVHNQLVGRSVFNTSTNEGGKHKERNKWGQHPENNIIKLTGTDPSLVRLYAHCTKESIRYPRGALTVFGISLRNDTEIVTFDPTVANQKLHQYLLTPVGNDGLLSKEIALNGETLRLIDDETFPTLMPVILSNASSGIRFPGLTMAFWVFPNANIKSCI